MILLLTSEGPGMYIDLDPMTGYRGLRDYLLAAEDGGKRLLTSSEWMKAANHRLYSSVPGSEYFALLTNEVHLEDRLLWRGSDTVPGEATASVVTRRCHFADSVTSVMLDDQGLVRDEYFHQLAYTPHRGEIASIDSTTGLAPFVVTNGRRYDDVIGEEPTHIFFHAQQRSPYGFHEEPTDKQHVVVRGRHSHGGDLERAGPWQIDFIDPRSVQVARACRDETPEEYQERLAWMAKQ